MKLRASPFADAQVRVLDVNFRRAEGAAKVDIKSRRFRRAFGPTKALALDVNFTRHRSTPPSGCRCSIWFKNTLPALATESTPAKHIS